jgi:hypothetical protein
MASGAREGGGGGAVKVDRYLCATLGLVPEKDYKAVWAPLTDVETVTKKRFAHAMIPQILW